MKWRNQILALLCLLIFIAFGFLYFQHWVVQKPFGIVLFIGEGLTADRVAATRAYAGGATSRLTIESLPAMALLSNYSQDFAVPDEAAAATALATGAKVNNRSLGIGPNDKRLLTIIDLARENGRAIGVVANGRLSDPTIAAFYASGQGDVLQQLAEKKKVDIALGGGLENFLPEAKRGRRTDGRDLVLEMRRNGYEIVRTNAELEAIPQWRRPKLLGLFSQGEMAYANEIAAGSEQPALADMTRRAIQLLQWNASGYLLIVDAGLMRTAARENRGERTLAETLELDRAVAVARSYMGKNSMILVTGNLGIGGLSLNGYPFRRDSGVGLLGINSSGEPALTWATGPNGITMPPAPPTTETPPPPGEGPVPNSVQEPAAAYAPWARNTLDDVLAAGSGQGTESLHGFLDNTVIFKIIAEQL
ncbi:MAG TPA: alkaline phosphatase [Chthoniobacterales bacterium]|jgi:alkaline phosphatase|nr:alkaline phosphatase [Chthoniobacterales bacterium]